jgi:pimeloyl-ACP methyl ester carboxylesterase
MLRSRRVAPDFVVPWKWALLFIAWLSLSGCTPSSHAQGGILRGSPLVFIHGFKGSTLVNHDGEIQWLSGLQALGLRTPNLALPLQWSGDAQARDGLSAGQILDQVNVIPWIASEKVYGPWLEAAREMGHPFYPFAYDWRRDNLESLEQFSRFIESVRRENQGAPVRVVAHSMGGLITLALLNQHPEYFQSVVFAGVPFAGGVGFLPDLHTGIPVGLNRKILSPAVLMTFPSVYALFPLNGTGLITVEGAPIPMDFFSADQWLEKKLGTVDSVSVPFLSGALARAKKFRQLLVGKKQSYPPILVVSGRSQPTLVTAIRNGLQSYLGWDFESAPQLPGDGRVAERDSVPPEGVPYRQMFSEKEHSGQLNDPVVIREIQKTMK